MSMFSARKRLIIVAFTPLLFAGCSMRSFPSASLAGVSLLGSIHGGEQPVAGATIQLYDATLGSTPLIGMPVTSDSNGNFSITGDWSSSDCLTPADQLYLVASGGNPGSGVNDNLVLMTALGTCGNLTASTRVVVNEVSTVATITAFFPSFDPTFGTRGQYLSYGDSVEYTAFLALVDPAAGLAVAGTNQQKLNALANSVTPCVNQTSTLGDTPQCDQIIYQAGSNYLGSISMDSAVAIFSVLDEPTYDPITVFNYAPANPPFIPTLIAAPSAWTFQ